MKKLWTSLTLSGLMLIFLASVVEASVPKLINYQGMLTDDLGNPSTGNYDMIFRIYNAASGGDLRWEETHNGVSVVNGLFNVILGSVDPTGLDLDFSEEYWLDITVGGEHMPTRLKLTSVGYAYRARIADTASVAVAAPTAGGWTDDGTIIRLKSDTDSVGIGTTTPSAKFDVRGTLNVGEDGTGHDVSFYGADNTGRMFWDQSKMALRAGKAGSQWDDDSVGQYSFATGLYTQAKGDYSVATGNATDANGNFSTAAGQLVTASGTFSTAIGQRATAAGSFSTAIGRWVTADTDHAIVLGTGTGGATPLVNDIPNSFMVGFDDTIPTLFVDGNVVGIGTTNPTAKLDVSGDLNVTGTINECRGQFVRVNTTISGEYVFDDAWYSNSRPDITTNGTAGEIYIDTHGGVAARIVIKEDGVVVVSTQGNTYTHTASDGKLLEIYVWPYSFVYQWFVHFTGAREGDYIAGLVKGGSG